MTTLAVLQPGYLPWLGFFDQVRRADVFVYYDDVQFDKHGWRNRNRVKSSQGPVWLTVPVLHKGRMGQRINEVRIDNSGRWARKHVRTLEQLYSKAPFISYLTRFQSVLEQPWEILADLDIALSQLMCECFGIERTMHRSSQLKIAGDRSSRLLNLCRHFDADSYLSGDAAETYLDEGMLADNGVRVIWQRYRHPTYPQLHGPFISHLSAIDLLLNVGERSAHVLEGLEPVNMSSDQKA